MTGPSEQDPRRQVPPSAIADPTRDIRLPPLPGRPRPALPPEWHGTDQDRVPAVGADDIRADQPTDRLTSPSEPGGNRTLTLGGTPSERWAAGHPATLGPAAPQAAPPAGPSAVPGAGRSRRWPWVVLTLLPVLVIVVTGVWLLILMYGG